MSRPYLRPTICSTLRAREGIGVKDRVQKLTHIIQELKEDVKAEVTATETLGKVEREHYNTMNKQVQALRRAFSDLADAICEEVEMIRIGTNEEMQKTVGDLYAKLQDVNIQSRQTEDAKHQLNTALTQAQRKALKHIEQLESRQEELSGEITKLKESLAQSQSAQKNLMAQLQQIVKNNSAHISSLFNDSKEITENLRQVTTQSESACNELQAHRSKLNKLDSDYKSLKDTLYNDFQTFSSQFKRDPSERHLNELNEKVKQLSKALTDRLEYMNSALDDKYTSLSNIVKQNHDLYQTQLQDLKYKIPDSKELVEKVSYLEELMTTHRREMFASMTSLEQSFVRKQESLTRAVFQLSKELQVTNPLLAY
jgi:chromosome segregation ATPase